MDTEQIVIEADASQVEREVGKANQAFDTWSNTVIRTSDRSKNSIDRLVTSMVKMGQTYGKDDLSRAIAQRDALLRSYGNEQRATEAITKAYDVVISKLRLVSEEKRRAAEASEKAAAQARREAEEAKRLAESQSHFSARYAILGVKDIAEGRSTFAMAEGVNFLRGLQGAPLMIGGVVAALGGLAGAFHKSIEDMGKFGLEMENLKTRTGIATKDLDQFVYAAKVMGQDATIYERMMRGLSEALGENSKEGDKAREALARLGVQVRDQFTGETKGTSEVLLAISDALNKLPEGFQRDAAAMDLFKRAGIEALPVIEQLRDNFRDANALGFGIKDEDLERWESFHKQIAATEAVFGLFLRHIEDLAASKVMSIFTAPGQIDSMLAQIANKNGSPLAPSTHIMSLADLGKTGQRMDADAYIKRMTGAETPEEKLRNAESVLSKLAKPVPGVTSIDDAKAYFAAMGQVDALKNQIKGAQQSKESANRLLSFSNSMDERDLMPMQKIAQQLVDFQKPREGQPALTQAQRGAAQRATMVAFYRQALKDQKELELATIEATGRGNEFVAEGSRSFLNGDDFKYLEASSKFDIEQGLLGYRKYQEHLRDADKTSLDIYSANAQHAGRMTSINSRRSGFGSEIDAAQQEYGIKQQIRNIELDTIAKHKDLYDITKETDRISLENAKDRMALEEQIAEIRKKEFDEVEKSTEKLVNTLFTKPGSFGKELGSTIHAAMLAPIVHGISTTVSGVVTPLIYGKDGQSGIHGALSGIFGGNKSNPVTVSTDQNTLATNQNTAALYAVASVATGTQVGSGTIGSGSTAASVPPMSSGGSNIPAVGAFGIAAALSSYAAYSQGGVQRQMNRNMIAAVGASFGRPGQIDASYNPVTFPVHNSWIPGAIAMAGGVAGSSVASQGGGDGSSDYGGPSGAATPPFVGAGGGGMPIPASRSNNGSLLQGVLGKNILGNLKGTNWGSFNRASGTWSNGDYGGETNDPAVYSPRRITGVGGVAGGLLGMGGMALASAGLMGKYRGSTRGIIEGTAGGAMLGMEYGGPIGAAIGAGVGLATGLVEKFAGFLSPQEKAIKYAKQMYGVTISMQTADQIAQLAQSKYGGNVQLAMRDPSTRQMLQLYAFGTGQAKSFPMSSTTPMGLSTSETNGKLYQDPTYMMGQQYQYQSTLPVAGGNQGMMLPGPTGTIQLNLNGQSAADLLAGKVASTVTPGYVQDQYASAMDMSSGRVDNSATLQQPGLIIS